MKWILRTLALIALVPILGFLWYYLGFGVLPETVGTVKINTLDLYEVEKNEDFEDKTFFLEFNYLKNTDGTGKQLFEGMFSTYMGIDTSNKFAKGFQIYADEITHTTKYIDDETSGFLGLESHTYWYKVLSNQEVYFYDQSYETEDKEPFTIANSLGLSDGHSFMVSAGETPMKLNFKQRSVIEANTFMSDKNIFGVPYNYCLEIDVNFFIYHQLQNIKSLDAGTHIVTLDLSNFFDCYLYNEDSMQYDKLTADTQFTYVQAKINVEDAGCQKREQSLFGMIANNQDDSTYSQSGLFWKTENNVTLTNTSFVNDSGYLTLDKTIASDLLKYEDIRVNIQITVDETIKGFSKECFSYLKDFYSLTMTSSEPVEIECYKYSIPDDVKITLKNVTLLEVANV